jgi:hypothetical protein
MRGNATVVPDVPRQASRGVLVAAANASRAIRLIVLT